MNAREMRAAGLLVAERLNSALSDDTQASIQVQSIDYTVDVHISSQSVDAVDAATNLATAFDLVREPDSTCERWVHHRWSGRFAGHPVSVVTLTKAPSEAHA